MRLFANANFLFIENRHVAYVFSTIVIVLGVAGMAFNIFSMGSWQNYGVDFTGGSLIQVQFRDVTTAAQLRSALGGAQAPPITRFGEENEFVIRAPLGEE